MQSPQVSLMGPGAGGGIGLGADGEYRRVSTLLTVLLVCLIFGSAQRSKGLC